jgi:hypothetical protein
MQNQPLMVLAFAVLSVCQITAHAQTPHAPSPGSPERQAICDAARAYVTEKYASAPLPEAIVFKIKHLIVAIGRLTCAMRRDKFCDLLK